MHRDSGEREREREREQTKEAERQVRVDDKTTLSTDSQALLKLTTKSAHSPSLNLQHEGRAENERESTRGFTRERQEEGEGEDL